MDEVRTLSASELLDEVKRGSSQIYVLCEEWYEVVGGQRFPYGGGAVFALRGKGGESIPAFSCQSRTPLTVAIYAKA